jgi:hypothetical protein
VLTGVHVIERARLRELEPLSESEAMPFVGVLDLARMVEGLVAEPEPGRPLGVVGLELALEAAGSGSQELAAALRGIIMAGKSYFEWKRIALVFAIDAPLEGALETSGPVVALPRGRMPLWPFFGKTLAPRIEGESHWWWSPQLG